MNQNYPLQNEIIPAIERAYFKKKTNDYIQYTDRFFDEGATIVQLIVSDQHKETLRKIKNKYSNLKIIAGGNIDSIKKASQYLEEQADYIVVGKFLAQNPELVKKWIKLFNQRLIVSINDKEGVLTDNDKVQTKIYADLLNKNNIKNVLYVSENTKLVGGINLDGFKGVRDIIKHAIIYSGGVSSLEDLMILKKAGAESVIVGTALYQKKFSYAEAKSAFYNS